MDSYSITPEMREMARTELARRELESRQSISGQQNDSSNPDEMQRRQNAYNQISNATGLNRTPIDTMRDIAAGGLEAGRNIAATLGEGGQAIGNMGARIATGKWPQNNVDIRQELGMGGNNPVDLRNIIGSSNPNPIIQGLAQYAPGIIAGGSSIPGQIISNSLYAGTQAQPQQQNAFGMLPSGRPGAMIESGVLASLPALFPKMVGTAKNAINRYFSPEKTYNQLLQDTGGGKTITENIQELSKRLGYGRQTAKEEALTPKREVMAESGDDRIFPSQKKGNDITKNTANLFAENPSDMTPEKMSKYKKALKTYYEGDFSNKDSDMHIQPGDIDSLVDKGEDIFDHPGLSDKNISQLEDSLIPEKKVSGEYLNIKDPDKQYSEILQDAHDKYVDNPTFRNSDILRSRLFKRINELSKRQKAQNITDSQESELNSLTKNRNAIIRDQENLIGTFSPENQVKYSKFNDKWRNEVIAYDEAGSTVKNMKNGYLDNVTPQKITNAFSFPELNPQLHKILGDIGPEGVNNIIFNEIGRTSNPKEVVNLIDSLEREKGFSRYITPEVKQYSRTIKNQMRNKNALLWGAGGLAGTFGAGSLYEAGKRAFS